MGERQPDHLFPTGGDDYVGNLYIRIPGEGWEHHDTGLRGYWDGYAFVIPFQDEMTAEECARIVSQALRGTREREE